MIQQTRYLNPTRKMHQISLVIYSYGVGLHQLSEIKKDHLYPPPPISGLYPTFRGQKEQYKKYHLNLVHDALETDTIKREARWSKRIAIGEKQFVSKIKKET
ncbi:hypothetical protein [Desulfocicer niacini]